AVAVALQSDGKLVAVGYWDVARYNTDGTLDGSFGTGGIVTRAPPYNDLLAVVLQADGKIVVAGGEAASNHPYYALVRYNEDGTLDPSFGTGGSVRTDGGWGNAGSALFNAVAMQPDGKIVTAGVRSGVIGGGTLLVLARYNGDGTLDPSFGTGGMVTDAVMPGARTVALQPDGKLVAVGPWGVARYNADGTLDSTFGTGGVSIGGGVRDPAGATLQPDGKLVVVGGTWLWIQDSSCSHAISSRAAATAWSTPERRATMDRRTVRSARVARWRATADRPARAAGASTTTSARTVSATAVERAPRW
ncbi:MAG: hypothetical protein ACREQL_05175, partial [Candidatus Binatia bacterium]